MCVDKIKDTPPSTQILYTGQLSTTPAKILGRNVRRRAIWVSANTVNDQFIYFGPGAPTATNPGIFLIHNTNGILFRFNDVGSAMQQELWLTAQAGTPNYFVSEFVDGSPEPSEG